MVTVTIKTAGGGLGMPTAVAATGTEYMHAVQSQSGSYTDVALPLNAIGSGIMYTPPGGSVSRSLNSRLSDVVSVADFGAVGDGIVDDTAAMQAAITYCIGSQTSGSQAPLSLYLPDGNYKITASLLICTGNTATLTGFRMYGSGRYCAKITQFTNNTPIFTLAPNLMHSCLFENMYFTFNSFQGTGNPNGNVFQCNGTISNDIYNCKWSNIGANNFYYFMNAPTLLWWGNAYDFCWLGDCYLGINNIQGASGEPRNTFTNLYISCNSCIGALFNHNACYCSFYNIEVNNALTGATMLFDQGGGDYIIGHWALETATYASGTFNLFNFPNGYLKAEFIYTNALTISAGVTVNAFTTNNNGIARFDVGQFTASFSSNAGNFYCSHTPGPCVSHFRFLDNINIPSANVQLTNVVGTTDANNVAVDEWSATNIAQMNGNALSVSLGHYSPVMQIFGTNLAGTTNVTLPEHRQNTSCNLFTGRRFKIVKTTTSGGQLNLLDITGANVGTIATGNRGIIEVMWVRSGSNTACSWMVMDSRTY